MKRFLIFFACVSAFSYQDPNRGFDFEFKEMEMYRAAESIAKLVNKYVIFDSKVANKLVNLSLYDVSPEFAMKILLESNGAYASEKGGIFYVSSAADRGVASNTPVIVPLVNVIAEDIDANVKGFLPPTATYTINKQRNAFVISAKEEDLERVRKLIQELDQEVNQIFIEGKIIETSKEFSRKIGMEWGAASLRSGANASANAGAGAAGGAVSSVGYGTGINVSGFPKGTNNLLAGTHIGIGSGPGLDAILVAGERNGEVKIISSPKISTLNGVSATFDTNQSTQIPLQQTTTTPGGQGTAGQVLTTTIEQQLSFTVIPFIVSDDQVRIQIRLSKRDPGTTDIPTGINAGNTSQIDTGLLVKNGHTASLGGIFSQRADKTTNGVPFLSKIPILGLLFGNDERSKQDRELMIFLTPTIFKGKAPLLRRPRSTPETLPDEPETIGEALESLRSVPNNNVGAAYVAPVQSEPISAPTTNQPPLMPATTP